MSGIEKLYTVEEVAELAAVTGRTIRNYLKSGRLVGRKIGGQWRFPESEVQRLLTGADALEDDAMPNSAQEPEPAAWQQPAREASEPATPAYPQHYNEPAPLPSPSAPLERPAVPLSEPPREEEIASRISSALEGLNYEDNDMDTNAGAPPQYAQQASPQQHPYPQQPAPMPQPQAVPAQPAASQPATAYPYPAQEAPAAPPMMEQPTAPEKQVYKSQQPQAEPQNAYRPAQAPQAEQQAPQYNTPARPYSQHNPQAAPQQAPYYPPAAERQVQQQTVYNAPQTQPVARNTAGNQPPYPPDYGYGSAPVPPYAPAQDPYYPADPHYPAQGPVYPPSNMNMGGQMPQQPPVYPQGYPANQMPTYPMDPAQMGYYPNLYGQAMPTSAFAGNLGQPAAPAAESPEEPLEFPLQPEPEVEEEPELEVAPEFAAMEELPEEEEPAPAVPGLSDVGKKVFDYIAEVHDYSKGPQVCAVIDAQQSLASARKTSEQLNDIALQESEGGILCQSFVEFDERYYVARYTLFGSTAFLYRSIKLIG